MQPKSKTFTVGGHVGTTFDVIGHDNSPVLDYTCGHSHSNKKEAHACQQALIKIDAMMWKDSDVFMTGVDTTSTYL